jgi:hypothetical protein
MMSSHDWPLFLKAYPHLLRKRFPVGLQTTP